MKYKSVKVQWADGTKATVKPPKGGWLRYIIENPQVYTYIYGYTGTSPENKPFHLACVYPKQLKRLALGELVQLQNANP